MAFHGSMTFEQSMSEQYRQQFEAFLREQLNQWQQKAVQFIGAKLGLAAGNPWLAAISAVVAVLFDTAADPRKTGRAVIDKIGEQNAEWAAQAAPVRDDIVLPPGRATKEAVLVVESRGEPIPHGADILVIPFKQVAKVEWSLVGHASATNESAGRVEIVANRGGLWSVFVREVWGRGGVNVLFGRGTQTASGSTQIELPAGVYLVRAYGTNRYSSGRIVVRYLTVAEMPAPARQRNLAPWLLAGGLAVAVGAVAYASQD